MRRSVPSARPPPAHSLTVPGVTTVSPGAMLIGAAALNSGNPTVVITAPAGMTERWDLLGKRQEYDDALQAAAGNGGSKTWTFSDARAGVAWLAALRPAAGGTAGASSAPTPTPTPTPTPAPSSTSTPAITPSPGLSNGKGIALRPFAEYWGGNTAAMNGDFADLNAGNITWARIDLFYTASPNPNFDAAVQAAESHNVNLLVAVHKSPPS